MEQLDSPGLGPGAAETEREAAKGLFAKPQTKKLLTRKKCHVSSPTCPLLLLKRVVLSIGVY